MTAVINAHQLSRSFPGTPPIHALRDATLSVEPGEKVAIYGPSGAGKSTLLNLLGLLDGPTTGSYTVLGEETATMPARTKDRLRSQAIGFVFQQFQILGHRTTRENIDLKLSIARIPHAKRAALVDDALEKVGLTHRATSQARNLSGGEKQRLAIARAIVNRPQLLLADEPTGNLDARNTDLVLSLLDDFSAAGIAVVVITHSDRTAAWSHRNVFIYDGVLSATPPRS
ncbi:ABC transporter ATP-binding protein [Jonesia quinghaiensis]|uniref:ABC transporter ATP-binding protein n=1 Tax=Jonesia quinghaiensis TaxID=262806 RepID=UPI00040830EA|nr:ABC transporter ATP-binding protein [Jonesia quinghaiensis]